MYFTENRYDRNIESMMKGIPNFYPRGSGIVVTGKADLIETEQRYRKNDAKSSLLYRLKPR